MNDRPGQKASRKAIALLVATGPFHLQFALILLGGDVLGERGRGGHIPGTVMFAWRGERV